MFKKLIHPIQPTLRAKTRLTQAKQQMSDYLLVFKWVAGVIPTARVFSIPYFVFKGSLVDSRLRASNEHILIVRVPRAGGRPGCPSYPSEGARSASTETMPATSPSFPCACRPFVITEQV